MYVYSFLKIEINATNSQQTEEITAYQVLSTLCIFEMNFISAEYWRMRSCLIFSCAGINFIHRRVNFNSKSYVF